MLRYLVAKLGLGCSIFNIHVEKKELCGMTHQRQTGGSSFVGDPQNFNMLNLTPKRHRLGLHPLLHTRDITCIVLSIYATDSLQQRGDSGQTQRYTTQHAAHLWRSMLYSEESRRMSASSVIINTTSSICSRLSSSTFANNNNCVVVNAWWLLFLIV